MLENLVAPIIINRYKRTSVTVDFLRSSYYSYLSGMDSQSLIQIARLVIENTECCSAV